MAIFFARNKGLRETLCRVPHLSPPSSVPLAASPFPLSLPPSSAVPSEEGPGRSDVIRTPPPSPSARTAEEEEEEAGAGRRRNWRRKQAACAHMKKSRGKNPFLS